MAFVYWLHLETHADIASEGYVGVTTKEPSERFNEHYLAAYKSRYLKKRPTLHLAFDRWGSMAIHCMPIYEGSEHECYAIERMLRPRTNIAWNTERGG